MQTIFIQVKCDMGEAYKAASKIIEVDSVSEVYSTSGHYDLMVKCHLADDVDAGHYVTNEIQPLGGIQETFTIITFNAFT